MTNQRTIVEFIKPLRAEGKQWSAIAKEVKKAGYTAPSGKEYGPSALTAMLLKVYPSMRTVAEYTKGSKTNINGRARPHSTNAETELIIVESIIRAKNLDAGQKLAAVSRLTAHWAKA